MGPGKDTHGTLGPVRGKAVGGPNNAPKGEVTRHDASLNHDNRQAFRQTIWDTHSVSGNVFANPAASSSAPYPQELNPWSSHLSEPIHSSPAGKNENQTPVQDLRCQSGPSAKDSVIFSGGDFTKNYGADQRRLQISDPHFDNSYTSHVCLLEDNIQDRGTVPFKTNSNDFGSFWNLISRFEFEFLSLRELFFLKDSKFWCVDANVPWHVLYPRNSISNVVASVTIHDDMCIYIYEKMEKMKRKT